MLPLRQVFASLLFQFLLAASVAGQGAQPFVDYWDVKTKVKRSEGLMVNGREWGEWKF